MDNIEEEPKNSAILSIYMQNACYAVALIAIWNLWCVNRTFVFPLHERGWLKEPTTQQYDFM